MSDKPILGDAAGPIVEVPAQEYAKGILLGVVGLHVEPRYLILPKGVPACVPHYRRCVNIRKDGSAVCYEPNRMGSLPNSEEIIPADQIARVMILYRGHLDEQSIVEVRDAEGRFERQPIEIAFAKFLQSLTIGIEAHADPSLCFSTWLSKQDPARWRYPDASPKGYCDLMEDARDKHHDLEYVLL